MIFQSREVTALLQNNQISLEKKRISLNVAEAITNIKPKKEIFQNTHLSKNRLQMNMGWRKFILSMTISKKRK